MKNKLKDTDDLLESSVPTREYSCHKREEKDEKKNTAVNSKGSAVPECEESG